MNESVFTKSYILFDLPISCSIKIYFAKHSHCLEVIWGNFCKIAYSFSSSVKLFHLKVLGHCLKIKVIANVSKCS